VAFASKNGFIALIEKPFCNVSGGCVCWWLIGQTSVSALAMVFLIILQEVILYVALNLKQAKSAAFMPTFYVAQCLFSLLGGFAKFHENQHFSKEEIHDFLYGLGIVLLGCFILSMTWIDKQIARCCRCL